MSHSRIIAKLNEARNFLNNENYELSKRSYEECLSIFEKDVEEDLSSQTKIEYLTTKAEYYQLIGKVLFDENDTWGDARNNLIKSLDLLKEALDISTSQKKNELIKTNIEKMINQIIH